MDLCLALCRHAQRQPDRAQFGIRLHQLFRKCFESQFGLCRQGSGGVSVVLNLTGITPIDPAAQARNVRVSAIGRWV